MWYTLYLFLFIWVLSLMYTMCSSQFDLPGKKERQLHFKIFSLSLSFSPNQKRHLATNVDLYVVLKNTQDWLKDLNCYHHLTKNAQIYLHVHVQPSGTELKVMNITLIRTMKKMYVWCFFLWKYIAGEDMSIVLS